MQFKQQYGTSEKEFDRDEYRTPMEIFRPLDKVFNFDLDAAATYDNSLCPNCWTKEENGLIRPWIGSTWVNPPYSGGQYGAWLHRAQRDSKDFGHTIVLLVPASLETKHFEPVWESAHYLIIPHKRISYLSPSGTPIKGNSFLSAIVIFSPFAGGSSEYDLDLKLRDFVDSIGNIINLSRGLINPR